MKTYKVKCHLIPADCSTVPEVVAAHELLGADRTGEVLLARVSAQVPGQLVRAREPLATV